MILWHAARTKQSARLPRFRSRAINSRSSSVASAFARSEPPSTSSDGPEEIQDTDSSADDDRQYADHAQQSEDEDSHYALRRGSPTSKPTPRKVCQR